MSTGSGSTPAPGWEAALARESFPARLAAMKRAEEAAKRACPIDTGALVNTIEGEAAMDSMRGRLSAGDEEVDYAKYVEIGTRHQAAQPYLRPGIEAIGG